MFYASLVGEITKQIRYTNSRHIAELEYVSNGNKYTLSLIFYNDKLKHILKKGSKIFVSGRLKKVREKSIVKDELHVDYYHFVKCNEDILDISRKYSDF